MSEDTNKEFEDTFIKEGIQNMIDYPTNDSSAKLAKDLKQLAPSQTSAITAPSRKPSDPKILKWKVNKDTHELTLLKSDGNATKLSMEDAYGLTAEDFQELLCLELEKDADDLESLNFELQFKGQIREFFLRNKDQE